MQGINECLIPADYQKEVAIESIVSTMKKWQKLLFNFLKKHDDRAITDVLVQAKAEVDFDLYMGIVNLMEL